VLPTLISQRAARSREAKPEGKARKPPMLQIEKVVIADDRGQKLLCFYLTWVADEPDGRSAFVFYVMFT